MNTLIEERLDTLCNKLDVLTVRNNDNEPKESTRKSTRKRTKKE